MERQAGGKQWRKKWKRKRNKSDETIDKTFLLCKPQQRGCPPADAVIQQDAEKLLPDSASEYNPTLLSEMRRSEWSNKPDRRGTIAIAFLTRRKC